MNIFCTRLQGSTRSMESNYWILSQSIMYARVRQTASNNQWSQEYEYFLLSRDIQRHTLQIVCLNTFNLCILNQLLNGMALTWKFSKTESRDKPCSMSLFIMIWRSSSHTVAVRLASSHTMHLGIENYFWAYFEKRNFRLSSLLRYHTKKTEQRRAYAWAMYSCKTWLTKCKVWSPLRWSHERSSFKAAAYNVWHITTSELDLAPRQLLTTET